MNLSFEQALIDVWRQALVENAKAVELGSERYPVRSTPKRSICRCASGIIDPTKPKQTSILEPGPAKKPS